MDEKFAFAVEAIKSNLSPFAHHPYRAVNRSAAVAALLCVLQVEDSEAQELCRVAVERHLGGYIESKVITGGLRGGHPPRRTVQESWWVDASAVE
ncbi:MAG TPA: hypothetical protein VFJ53_07555 [Solirubrobacterales bacterium]|nr:hypothetical protein [Solirubrobacterales bacterium]